MEACAVSGKEMEDFKEEVRSEIKQMARSVDKLSNAVQTLVENDIRKQEREDRQAELNDRMAERVLKLENFREDILIKRSEESSSRNWLMKNYPWLAVLAVIGIAWLSKFPIK